MADSWSSVNSPEKDLAGKVTSWYDEVKMIIGFITSFSALITGKNSVTELF